MRSLAVLMSALVALSAQAQDASTTESEGKPAPAARSAKVKRSLLIASRAQPVERGRPVPEPSAPQAKPDAGVDASTRAGPIDCGMTQWISSEKEVPVAVRFYPEREPAASPQEDGPGRTWNAALKPWKAGRCLQKYFIQVRNSSKEPWAIKDAALEGADGEILKVTDVQSYLDPDQGNITIVVAEKTKGAAEPNYRVAKFHLIGKDGRVIALPGFDLP